MLKIKVWKTLYIYIYIYSIVYTICVCVYISETVYVCVCLCVSEKVTKMNLGNNLMILVKAGVATLKSEKIKFMTEIIARDRGPLQ